MAQNILKLANTAGAKVIVDDLGFGDEPFFQPGLITQSINQVTSQGVTYLSAAGNEANHGYLSTFRAASGDVTGVGTGTFMNFDPSGGTNLLLPITVNEANTNIDFQFDQPWATQEPTGSPGPTSQVDFYVLDGAGKVIASGTNNNVATQEPQQFVTIPSTGSYFVAIELVSGPNPGHVEFAQFGQQSTNDMIVSQQFGSAGGTYYPTSFGHNASANNIGVGAVPWWSPPPFLGQSPLASEPYSSSGPEIQVLDENGAPLSSPLTIQNPSVTAPDGGNTTFFGFVAATNNPPFPGQPATSTNLYASFTPDQENLPSFFGTSSATPNTAAIAALMLQRVPSATPAQIKAALIESAATTPMNAAADEQLGVLRYVLRGAQRSGRCRPHAPAGTDGNPGSDQSGPDRVGRHESLECLRAGHMERAGRLRPHQRRQRHQLHRCAPDPLDRPRQRLDGDRHPQRHHGHVQQARRFLDRQSQRHPVHVHAPWSERGAGYAPGDR